MGYSNNQNIVNIVRVNAIHHRFTVVAKLLQFLWALKKLPQKLFEKTPSFVTSK